MKTKKIVKKALIYWSFIGMLLFVACTDITDMIGGEFVQGGPLNMHFNFMDTTTLETYSILKDSVETSGSSVQLLGSINDPIFGKITAGIYSKFLYVGTGFDSLFHAAEFFDSIVLWFAYSGDYYGDTLVEQTIKVYELEEILSDSLSYYSHQTAQYNPVPIVTTTYFPTPNPDYSQNVDEEEGEEAPKIKIVIAKSQDNPFAQKLLEIWDTTYIYIDTVNDQTYETVDYEKFYEFFKGLYITVEPVADGLDGALIGVRPYSTSTEIRVYKHDTAEIEDDSIININRFATLVTSSSYGQVFNHFDHDYQNVNDNFREEVLNGNKEIGQHKVFVQALAGTHTRIKFPYLKNLLDLGDKIAINKAELIFSAATDLEFEKFEAPPELSVQVQFNNDSISFVPDLLLGSNWIDGELDTLTNEYRFRVTLYVQEVLDGLNEGEDGLYIFSSSEYNEYHRVTLFGTDPEGDSYDNKRARLEIYYTIIDE